MSETDGDLASVVERARDGSRAALEELVEAIRDDVYNLAVRMLWHPEDAEDATQEILIRVITGLDSFRGESRFRTWVYRVAVNHLLTVRRSRAERPELTFESFAEDLEAGLSDDPVRAASNDAQEAVLIEEVKLGCSQGMLLCLDRDHRAAYVLGELLGLDHREGAAVLEISPDAYRKRLSRARRRLHGFLRRHCGLVSDEAPCRCRKRVDRAVELGRVDPERLLFADRLRADPEVVGQWRRVEEIVDEASVLRSHPLYREPGRSTEALRGLIEGV